MNKLGIFLGGMLLASASYANVAKLLPKSFAAMIETDDSSQYSKGETLCIADESGKKVGCGKVVKISGQKVYAKFSKATFPKIQVGMVPMGKTTSGTATAPTKGTKGGKLPLVIRLKWAPQFISPVSYSTVSYDAPRSDDTSARSNWKSEAAVNQALMAFELEGQIPMGGGAITPGLRMKTQGSATVLSDLYSDRRAATDPYLENVHTSSAMGFWVDYVIKYMPVLSSISMPLSAGLDFESHTVKMASSQKTDSTGATADFATAESSLTAVSLRAGVGLDMKLFGGIGGSFGATLLIPVTALNAKYSYSGTNNANGDQGESLKAALAHKKGTFGLLLGIGLIGSF